MIPALRNVVILINVLLRMRLVVVEVGGNTALQIILYVAVKIVV